MKNNNPTRDQWLALAIAGCVVITLVLKIMIINM